MYIGEKLKQLRIEQGLTQEQLGERCIPPMNPTVIRRYETNSGNPKVGTICRLASALNVNPRVFLKDSTVLVDNVQGMVSVELIRAHMLKYINQEEQHARAHEYREAIECAGARKALQSILQSVSKEMHNDNW